MRGTVQDYPCKSLQEIHFYKSIFNYFLCPTKIASKLAARLDNPSFRSQVMVDSIPEGESGLHLRKQTPQESRREINQCLQVDVNMIVNHIHTFFYLKKAYFIDLKSRWSRLRAVPVAIFNFTENGLWGTNLQAVERPRQKESFLET